MLKKTMSGHGASTQEKTAALTRYSQMSDQAVYQALKTNPDGLSSTEAVDRLEAVGANTVVTQHPRPWYLILLSAFNEPFVWVLVFLVAVSTATADYDGAMMMSLMIVLSVTIHFW